MVLPHVFLIEVIFNEGCFLSSWGGAVQMAGNAGLLTFWLNMSLKDVLKLY